MSLAEIGLIGRDLVVFVITFRGIVPLCHIVWSDVPHFRISAHKKTTLFHAYDASGIALR